ncbi:unnamed protein product [Moneuplotes crassus]|uniref:Uncharacterized protein n=1 Tax=Euplotes crassus TaxID=5936 RepID=A0AAD1U9W3_EUPCR|nr:unnamed protein product [Moneuplotes crassus]
MSDKLNSQLWHDPLADRYYHIIDGEGNVQCKKDGSPIIKNRFGQARCSLERSLHKTLKKVRMPMDSETIQRNKEEKFIMPCFTKGGNKNNKSKNGLGDKNKRDIQIGRFSNLKLCRGKSRSKREGGFETSFKRKAYEVLNTKSAEFRAIHNASTLTVEDRLSKEGCSMFLTASKDATNKRDLGIKMPELPSTRRNKEITSTTLNSKKGSYLPLQVYEGRNNANLSNKFKTEERISYFKEKISQIRFGKTKVGKTPGIVIKNKVTKIPIPLVNLFKKRNNSDSKKKIDLSIQSEQKIFPRKNSSVFKPYQNTNPLKSFLERDYAKDRERTISSISSEEIYNPISPPHILESALKDQDRSINSVQKVLNCINVKDGQKICLEKAKGRVDRLGCMNSRETGSKEGKYERIVKMKRKEYEEWDRKVLERHRKVRLREQEKWLKKIIERNKFKEKGV